MDPVTITIMALMAAGGLFKGISSYAAGKQQKKQADLAAVQAAQEGSVQANLALDEADRAGGEAAVQGAHNGSGFDGSFQDALGDLERKGMFNVRSALWAGGTKSENLRYEGRIAQKNGALGAVQAGFDTATSMASTFAAKAEAKKQRAILSKMGS